MTANKTSIKDAVAKIKKLIFDATTPPAADPAATGTDYTLKDGTTIKVQGELAQGTAVVVVTDQGNNPIPDGEYELNDGTSITCTGGLIAEVESQQQEDAEGMEMKAKMAEQEKALGSLVSNMKTIADAVGILQGGFKKQNEAFTQVLELVESLAEAPAEEPAEKNKTAFSKKVDQNERMKDLQAALKKMKDSK